MRLLGARPWLCSLDGNMKNARQVCMVKDVAELRFSAMDGSIVVGCQNTPARGSRFCSEHCATAISFRDDSDESNNIQETHNSDQMGALITRILNEKTTRQGVIYQVLWADGRQSWVKKCNLPPKIRDALEDGSNYQQQPRVFYEFGQQRTELKECSLPSPSGLHYGVKTTGFAIEKESNEKDILLTCGTEKGKHKCKNHRTAVTNIMKIMRTERMGYLPLPPQERDHASMKFQQKIDSTLHIPLKNMSKSPLANNCY